MKISWIYVIDDRGVPICLYESYSEGTKDSNHVLISRFIQQLLLISVNFKPEEIREIKIENSKYYMMQEQESQYIFIIKPLNDEDLEDIIPFLKKIMNLFIKEYAQYMNEIIDDIKTVLEHLKDYIWKLIELELDVGAL